MEEVKRSPGTIPLVGNLRDQIAMAAMAGMLASFASWTDMGALQVAQLAYKTADAMLKVREEK